MRNNYLRRYIVAYTYERLDKLVNVVRNPEQAVFIMKTISESVRRHIISKEDKVTLVDVMKSKGVM